MKTMQFSCIQHAKKYSLKLFAPKKCFILKSASCEFLAFTGKCKRPKKISKAAETHKFTRMKTTNYGRCKICDAYVYFWGYQCKEVRIYQIFINVNK